MISSYAELFGGIGLEAENAQTKMIQDIEQTSAARMKKRERDRERHRERERDREDKQTDNQVTVSYFSCSSKAPESWEPKRCGESQQSIR